MDNRTAPGGDEQFPGHKDDPESGLHYNLARSYDPTMSRWISADKVMPNAYDLQSLNKYSYNNNNPINLLDPSGNSPWSSEMGGSSTVCTVDGIEVDCGLAIGMLGNGFGAQITFGTPQAYYDPQKGGYQVLDGVINGIPVYAQAPPPPSPEPQTEVITSWEITAIDPGCSAELMGRFVDGVAGALGAIHTFWLVEDRTETSYIFSGYPTDDLAYLNAYASNNIFTGTDNVFANSLYIVPYIYCQGVRQMISAANTWPQNLINYNPALGPNSNSVANYLGQQGGITVPFNLPIFGTAFGWSTSPFAELPAGHR
jgi:RHS repeat-associated protein